eukprot:COSAG02_NODE_22038_length_765_cov_9.244745_1_plen_56_part_01
MGGLVDKATRETRVSQSGKLYNVGEITEKYDLCRFMPISCHYACFAANHVIMLKAM